MKTLLLASAMLALAVVATETVLAPSTLQSLQQLEKGVRHRPPPEPPPFQTLGAMQAEFVRRFEESPGFGLSRVVRPRFLAPVPALVLNGATYRVVPPELVGLEDEPVVYAPREHGLTYSPAATNATRREIRKLFRSRSLSEIETSAVTALRAGRDLVAITNRVVAEARVELLSPPDLLVFGPLRAGRTCASCHQCNEGTLLGAFAYTLTPMGRPADAATNSPVATAKLVARLTAPTPALARSAGSRSRL
jgi:hypothetical protein